MSDARNAILQRLRASQQNNVATAPSTAATRPALPTDRLSHFKAKLTSNVISCDEVNDDGGVVKSVVDFLRQNQLPMQLCVVPDKRLADLPWPAQITVAQRMIAASDLNCLSIAHAAIAETGSVVMHSGHDTPTEANFLPDNFICIVERNSLLSHMEDLWAQLRSDGGKPPAVINIISGPSRTADVEQTIQLGAHGPRRMHVIISG